MTTNAVSRPLLMSSEAPPTDYDRAPSYERMVRDIDVMVPMRDGVKICVDIYRPDTTEKLPALLAFAIYNKDFQGPDVARDIAAAAGLDAAVDRAARSGRHAFPRVARLYPRHRVAARRWQIRRRRFAAMGQLRPDRVDRGAAVVRRQCRHGWHLRDSAPSSSMSPSSSRRI